MILVACFYISLVIGVPDPDCPMTALERIRWIFCAFCFAIYVPVIGGVVEPVLAFLFGRETSLIVGSLWGSVFYSALITVGSAIKRRGSDHHVKPAEHIPDNAV